MKSALVRYLPLLILALAWEAVARLGLVSALALPPLGKVMAAWIDLVRDGELVQNGAASLYRAGLGLALAVVIGAALGIAMAWWRSVNVLVGPLVELIYPMPKSALIPVTVLWLGFGDGSKILLIFLGCMLPVTLAAFNGARGADRMLVWSARSNGGRPVAGVARRRAAERDAGAAQRHPHRARARLHPAGQLRADRGAAGVRLPDRLSGASGAYEGMFAVVLTVAMLGFAADRAYGALMRRALQWRD